VFTCVGWQVTLYDPIWQMTLRSCVMGYVPLTATQYLYLFICQRGSRNSHRQTSGIAGNGGRGARILDTDINW